MSAPTLLTKRDKTGAETAASDLKALFEARSIAIIGASADPTKLGSSPVIAMKYLGFQGRISIVNPRHTTLLGHPCYASISDLPSDIEAAMIIVPAEAAVAAAEECVGLGIKSLVIVSQGFGEAGGEGIARDRRLLELAARGAAIIGPNTNGIANVSSGLALSIAPIFQYAGRVPPGNVSLVSQSGAMVSSLLARIGGSGIGISKIVTCGNELVLGVADYVRYLAEDPETRLIALYLETIRDIGAFQAALSAARSAGKPVVAIKIGESEGAQKAALSHTGAIAGSYRNITAFLEREGVYVADDLETLALLVECLIRYDWSEGDAPAKPFVASISGGFAAHTADLMARLDMPLPEPSPAGAERLEALPTQSHAVNPYDIAAQNNLIPEILKIATEDGYNQLLFGLVMLKPEIRDQVAAILVEAKRTSFDRMFLLAPQVQPSEREMFNEAGILITDNSQALLKALKAIEIKRARASIGSWPAEVRSLSEKLELPAREGLLDEAESKRLVTHLGIRSPMSVSVPVSGTIDAFSQLSRPLAMKGLSDKIAHKTEYGLVKLNLHTDEDVRNAWETIRAALASADPAADSILIEEMVMGGLEAILGVQRDETVGPVVVVGAGGILVELLRDNVVLIPPCSPDEIAFALSQTRFGRLLEGYRGRFYDIQALAEAASAIGDAALSMPQIASIDLNPLLVKPKGEGIVALDAKIFLQQ